MVGASGRLALPAYACHRWPPLGNSHVTGSLLDPFRQVREIRRPNTLWYVFLSIVLVCILTVVASDYIKRALYSLASGLHVDAEIDLHVTVRWLCSLVNVDLIVN